MLNKLLNLFIVSITLLLTGCPSQPITPSHPVPIEPKLHTLGLPSAAKISESYVNTCPDMKIVSSARSTEILFPSYCLGRSISLTLNGIVYTTQLSVVPQALVPKQQPEVLAKITLPSDAVIIDWTKCPEIEVFSKLGGKEVHFPKRCFGKGVEISTGNQVRPLDDFAYKSQSQPEKVTTQSELERRRQRKKRQQEKRQQKLQREQRKQQEELQREQERQRKLQRKRKRQQELQRERERQRKLQRERKRQQELQKRKQQKQQKLQQLLNLGNWHIEKKARGKTNHQNAAATCRRLGMQLPEKGVLVNGANRGKIHLSRSGEWSGNSTTREAYAVKDNKSIIVEKSLQLPYRCAKRVK